MLFERELRPGILAAQTTRTGLAKLAHTKTAVRPSGRYIFPNTEKFTHNHSKKFVLVVKARVALKCYRSRSHRKSSLASANRVWRRTATHERERVHLEKGDK